MVQDGAHHRPMTMSRQGEYGSVPNVREEISGLREIERLRGVVGGLAKGMYEARAVGMGNDGAGEEGEEAVEGVNDPVEHVMGAAAQGDLTARVDEEERPDGELDAREEAESEDEVEAEVAADVRGTPQAEFTTLSPAFIQVSRGAPRWLILRLLPFRSI